jgi:hypothetical protein
MVFFICLLKLLFHIFLLVYLVYGIVAVRYLLSQQGCLQYGCKTWSLTLREEHELGIFENGVLRMIFEPKREEDRSWRKLHNNKLHGLYSSPNVVKVIKPRRMKWAGHVALVGEERGVYRILVGRPEGTRPLGRPWCRWEDNINMVLMEIGIDGVNWIHLAQDRVQ